MKYLVFAALTFLAACSGGGGSDAEPETGYRFLEADPSEEVLCSFIIGVTTREQVLDTLGEPTNVSDHAAGSTLQYWIGSQAELARSGVRALVLGFDERGLLDDPYAQGVPFPQCWRDQIAALESN